MPIEFALPDLGENIENGDVVSVLVAVGDTLAEDQPVIELETDKAVIEVPSSISGTVTEILVQQGDTVAVGQAIIKVETSAPAAPAAPPPPAPETQAEAATIAIVNCMARPSRFHTPSPQAKIVSSSVAPAPKIHKKIARAVRTIQITQASGIHFSVKTERPAPISLNLFRISNFCSNGQNRLHFPVVLVWIQLL